MAKEGAPEYIQGKISAAAPPYALSGFQWGDSAALEVNGKRPSDGPPMNISISDPGIAMLEDEGWQLAYGASHDAYLTLINGRFITTSSDIVMGAIYKSGTVNKDNDNLWIKANDVHQVQFIATGETVDEGLESAKDDRASDPDFYRGVGLRVPAMAGGYGRTVDGRPTDPEPSDDIGGRENDDAHKLARETWKYGPVEYRWDYRKGVWSAFNDMIADHYGQDLGTWVFGTNSDFTEGFPFLRGKLEDAFWVRQLSDKDGANGRIEGVQTAELLTHLNHKWFDPEENGAAALSSIFIIPHANSTDPDCHPQGAENIVGPETTGDGLAIDIKTSAHFFESPGVDGAIGFNGKASDKNICCEPLNKKYHLGEMVFKDQPSRICSSEDFIVVVDDPLMCKWVPAIAIDECELAGGHINDLIYNDVELASNIAAQCAITALYSQNMRTTLNSNFTLLSVLFEDLQDEIEKTFNTVTFCLNKEIKSVWTSLDLFRDEMREAMDDYDAQINAKLNACCPEEIGTQINWNEPPSIGAHDYPDPCPVNFTETLFLYSDFPEIPCDSCPPIGLWTPCTDQMSIAVTGGCDPVSPAVPDGGGDCQVNSSKTSQVVGGAANTGTKSQISEDGPGVKAPGIPELQVFFAGAGFIEVTPV